MGVVTVKVDVGNVFPPKKIRVVINNFDGEPDYDIEIEKSFTRDFPVTAGKHSIIVFGWNQLEHETTISISGDIVCPTYTRTEKGKKYVSVFEGRVN